MRIIKGKTKFSIIIKRILTLDIISALVDQISAAYEDNMPQEVKKLVETLTIGAAKCWQEIAPSGQLELCCHELKTYQKANKRIAKTILAEWSKVTNPKVFIMAIATYAENSKDEMGEGGNGNWTDMLAALYEVYKIFDAEEKYEDKEVDEAIRIGELLIKTSNQG